MWKPTKKYWSGFDALYGDGGKSIVPTSAKDVSAPRKAASDLRRALLPTEEEEQIKGVVWLDNRNIPRHHSPNGGKRNWKEAVKFKRMGVSAGFPDIFIPLARKGHHGLFIELKRQEGGRLSHHQEWWRDLLLKEGYAWFEAKGAAEMISIVEEYLHGTK